MKKCIVATTIVFDKTRGKTLLLKHTKLGVWLPPGGHVDEGELPDEAAVREVYEETGIRITILNPSKISILPDNNAKQVCSPFLVLRENVPYKDNPHTHFDLLYVGEAASTKITESKESTNIGWFDQTESQKLEMFPNVRQCLDAAFDEFGK